MKRYIKKTEFVSFEAATITLRLPSAMYMDVVISQYGTMFSEAFAAVMGFEVKIKYVCAEDNDREEHKFYQDKQHLEDYKNEQYTFENFIVETENASLLFGRMTASLSREKRRSPRRSPPRCSKTEKQR